MIVILLVIAALGVAAALVINLHPVFGGNPSREQKERYLTLGHYVKGKFVNQVPTKMDISVSEYVSMLKETLSGAEGRKPAGPLLVSKVDWSRINKGEDSLTWFGHSAFLLTLDQKKLLIDPMLGPVASPVSFVGSKRYSKDLLPIIDEMPRIDAVLITHDHYDHLDYPSIRKLKDKVGHFFVPCGVGTHLIRWGVAEEAITELHWWEEVQFQGLTIALTPSQHFSGRGPANRDTTLWGGWVILGSSTRFYTSGDGGYGAHFQEIGEKYGPFDIALIEGGQYDRRWSWVHMTPEEAVQAHADVRGNTMMLIHWGAFTLAYHGWAEPIERAITEAAKANVRLIAPQIGETVALHGELTAAANAPWWKSPV
ncbi:MBL fold metallo-hydrolase [Gorillibacterium sp. sgz5001074]|uniref:MBL fold metallo-hydrolase n=1 Tax=Gorillibacterium sp. sgz5001074 TaxID=3446695 RepID=UPI003F66567A